MKNDYKNFVLKPQRDGGGNNFNYRIRLWRKAALKPGIWKNIFQGALKIEIYFF